MAGTQKTLRKDIVIAGAGYVGLATAVADQILCAGHRHPSG